VLAHYFGRIAKQRYHFFHGEAVLQVLNCERIPQAMPVHVDGLAIDAAKDVRVFSNRNLPQAAIFFTQFETSLFTLLRLDQKK
jgi:hypothetical protein